MEMELAAWVASTLVFTSFFMKTMIPLRLVAIASNVAFIAFALLGMRYGIFEKVLPILVLHSMLLPLNLLRVREATLDKMGLHEGTACKETESRDRCRRRAAGCVVAARPGMAARRVRPHADRLRY
jgi:hypothetical protein